MQAPDRFQIYSGSASRPGWISVEAASLAAVQELSKGKHPQCVLAPTPALFDKYEAKKHCGETSVEVWNQTRLFRNHLFEDGYLSLRTQKFYSEEVIPTGKEISMFEKSKVIPREMILRGLERAAMCCVTVGDPVKIQDEEDVTVSIPLEALCKDMRIGDKVLVTGGAQIGLTGWVVSVDGEALQIYIRKLAKQFNVMSRQVIWCASACNGDGGRMGIKMHTRFGRDLLKKYIGRHVQIVNAGSPWKGYKGVIKSSADSDTVLVELHATMKQEAIPFKNL
ncbi:hypothetical protein H0H81_000565 [Sphagnurus paluster]|uniref:KOW domain-containing protein n=1 Tax=Sphagnurus paluster TaxID=117069 RepID=A0A9P7GI56_9AGAR|nr:hypothetical protein H0H81_000565 [Sphagnurus paluster]